MKKTKNHHLTPKPFTTAHLKASHHFKPWKLRRVAGRGRDVARRKPKYKEEPQKKKNGTSGWELMWLVNMLVQGIVKVVSMIYSVPDWIVSLLASLITSWTGMTLMWYLMEMSTLGSMEACLSYLCEAVITNMMWRTIANTVGVVRLIMKGGTNSPQYLLKFWMIMLLMCMCVGTVQAMDAESTKAMSKVIKKIPTTNSLSGLASLSGKKKKDKKAPARAKKTNKGPNKAMKKAIANNKRTIVNWKKRKTREQSDIQSPKQAVKQ